MTRRLAYLVHASARRGEELQYRRHPAVVGGAIDRERRYRFVIPRLRGAGGPGAGRRWSLRTAEEVVRRRCWRPSSRRWPGARGERSDLELRSPVARRHLRELEVTLVPRLDADGSVEGMVSWLRRHRRAAGARARAFPGPRTEILTSSLEMERTSRRWRRMAVPLLGDFCSLQSSSTASSSGAPRPEAAPAAGDPAAHVFETGHAEIGTTALGLPLVARGEVLGALGLVTSPSRNRGRRARRRGAGAPGRARRRERRCTADARARAGGARGAHGGGHARPCHPLGVVRSRPGSSPPRSPTAPPAQRRVAGARADRIDYLIRTLMDAARSSAASCAWIARVTTRGAGREAVDSSRGWPPSARSAWALERRTR